MADNGLSILTVYRFSTNFKILLHRNSLIDCYEILEGCPLGDSLSDFSRLSLLERLPVNGQSLHQSSKESIWLSLGFPQKF